MSIEIVAAEELLRIGRLTYDEYRMGFKNKVLIIFNSEAHEIELAFFNYLKEEIKEKEEFKIQFQQKQVWCIVSDNKVRGIENYFRKNNLKYEKKDYPIF